MHRVSVNVFKTSFAEVFIKIQQPIETLLTHSKSNKITKFNYLLFTKILIKTIPKIVICFKIPGNSL